MNPTGLIATHASASMATARIGQLRQTGIPVGLSGYATVATDAGSQNKVEPALTCAPVAIEEGGRERVQPLLGNRLTQALHQPLIEPQIVLGHQHRAEDLARLHQMMDVGAAEGRAGWARAARLDRISVLGKARVA